MSLDLLFSSNALSKTTQNVVYGGLLPRFSFFALPVIELFYGCCVQFFYHPMRAAR